MSLGLIAWRGDRLRSPGTIDSPLSREGAFLANNVLFTVFAFVVLLGTVFPLLVEALQDRQTLVGAPYFDRLSHADRADAAVPDGRRAGAAVAQGVDRTAARRGCSGRRGAASGRWSIAVVVGADGWAPLVAFGLAGFAAGSALRQLVLATRRQGWRGFVGRANGGMVVHLGVIMIAVALAASNSYTHSATLDAESGEVVEWGGHTFELVSVDERTNDRESERALAANVMLDGGRSTAGDHDVPQHRAPTSARRGCGPGSPRTSTSRSTRAPPPATPRRRSGCSSSR